MQVRLPNKKKKNRPPSLKILVPPLRVSKHRA